jgi:hypothetical protein
MASEHRFYRVVLSVLAFLGSLLAVPIHSAGEAFRSFARFGDLIDWPAVKVDAAISLALDTLSRYAASLELGERMRQFKAFLTRALGHDQFNGEQFEFGRQPA